MIIMKLIIKYLDNTTKRVNKRCYNDVFSYSINKWPSAAKKLIDDINTTIIEIYLQPNVFERMESG